MQPFAALQIEEEGGGCTGADTDGRRYRMCDSVLGRTFLATKLQMGVTGLAPSWLASFNRWLGMVGQGSVSSNSRGWFHEQCTEPAVCT